VSAVTRDEDLPANAALPWRRGFLTPTTFAVATAAWIAVAAIVWARDILTVGPGVASLAPRELALTIQSMVMWGLFTPFILTASEWLEYERGRRLRALALHLVFALFLCALDVGIDLVMNVFTHLDKGSFGQRFYYELFINIFAYGAVAGIGYALVYYRRLAESHLVELELQRELTQTRLDVLARTLQPHFLFNALNTVAALVRLAENRRALTAVVALSDLLRIVLKTGGNVRVPLREELQFTDRYVAVERLRFEDNLQVSTNIVPGAEELLVPALILQPLVENAIRHGVEVSGHGRVSIEANATDQWLTMLVRVEARTQSADPRVAGLGIGLDVTRRRLIYLYGPERFTLDLLVGCGHSSVTLRIPREEILYVRADPDTHCG
jgi:two-component system, LytTR family, sensor kinase